eukprot:1156212-Pelagomonas_calceolata.AAC.6
MVLVPGSALQALAQHLQALTCTLIRQATSQQHQAYSWGVNELLVQHHITHSTSRSRWTLVYKEVP